ncbi:DMT family transporter [bacterium]|nr:DMT family transporter [bacterium]
MGKANNARYGYADGAMLAACFLWALGTVLTREAIGGMPGGFHVYIFNGIRLSIATVLLFGFIIATGRSPWIRREHIGLVALVSFFGFFLFMAIFHLGLSRTTASHAGILSGTIPLYIVGISALTGIEKPTIWVVIGIAVGFSGVAALTFRGGISDFNPGDLLVIISCLCWAIFTVFGKGIVDCYSPLVSMGWTFFFTTVYHIPLFIMQLPGQSWSAITPNNWGNACIAAVGPLFLANTLYYYSLGKIGPSRVGAYTNLEPAFTLLLVYLLSSRETITALHIVGLTAIMTGIGLTKFRNNMGNA